MKKFTILLMFVAFTTFVFAQNSRTNLNYDSPTFVEKNAKYAVPTGKDSYKRANNETKENYFTQDFEGTGVEWTTGNLEDGATTRFYVGSASDAFPSPGFQWISDAADRGFAWFESRFFKTGKAAYVDVVGDDADLGGPGYHTTNPYIMFENIDLTLAEAPKIVFHQYVRRLNAATMAVEWAVNGSSTWNTIQVNSDLEANTWRDNDVELLIPEAAGETISLRFVWKSEYTAPYPCGYWWLLDNIVITEALEYDLVLEDYRVSFFTWNDYHTADAIGEGTGEDGPFYFNRYFHLSSHYGHLAKTMNENQHMLAFHATITNNGTQSVNPGFRVNVVKDGETEPVWTKTIYSTTPVAPYKTDTIDMWDLGDNNDRFDIPENFATGKYSINFEALIEGQVDENIENNTGTATFFYTADTFGRDADNISALYNIAPKQYTASTGANGDKIGTNFWFTEDVQIAGIDFFLGDDSEAGTSFNIAVEQWNGEAFVPRATHLMDIEDGMAGEWQSFDFDLPAVIPIGDNISDVRVSFTFNYNGKTLTLGSDRSQMASYHGLSWYFEGDELWTNFVTQINISPAVRLRTIPKNSVKPNTLTNFEIYPNPTTGTLTIENIKGGSVEVLNMMGQVVSRIDNASEYNTVDISTLSNGTYFVRIVLDGKVGIEKVNLVK